jgi:hypothetical protein
VLPRRLNARRARPHRTGVRRMEPLRYEPLVELVVVLDLDDGDAPL